jgi:cytochrome b561
MRKFLEKFVSRQNLYALLICLILIGIIIMTSSQAPQWIYQGF